MAINAFAAGGTGAIRLKSGYGFQNPDILLVVHQRFEQMLLRVFGGDLFR
jgi:hypothetical protein